MKKYLKAIPIVPLLLLLGGCAPGEKSIRFSALYGAAAAISLALLVLCRILVRQKRSWFMLLFFSILVVNCGYTFLSLAPGLQAALWANRVSYLGSVLLPFSMLMILLNIMNSRYPRWLPQLLLWVALAVFLLAASPGILDLYYKEVSFTVVNGVSTLEKVYGPLHPVYLVYLLSYFGSMLTVILRGMVKKALDSVGHAAILLIAVGVNIGVWLVEQLVSIPFEMLAGSYIISECFLLGVHLVMTENQRLKTLVRTAEAVQSFRPAEPVAENGETQFIAGERMEAFVHGVEQLTKTERAIYEAYVSRRTTKEIMDAHGITENTLKYHNKNIYGKLGVTSRKEMLEIYKALTAQK